MSEDDTDTILGITRCARCGHRLEGDIECPFCSLFPEPPRTKGIPKWVYITACFLSSPLSLYALIRTERLSLLEKVLAFSGCLFWFSVYRLWF